MDVRYFIAKMERLAPPGLAEEFDSGKIGLVVEGVKEIRNVCCALDATQYVISRAQKMSADMLVVHHTPLWTPITRLTGHTARLIRPVLASRMNVFVMHTNFDHASGGVNDVLTDVLSLSGIRKMKLGLVGKCSLSVDDIARRVGGSVRVWGKIRKIDELAVVGGSGFDPDLIIEAKDLGADAFLSSELKHAVARASPLPCIEATHYALEAPAMRVLAKHMDWHFIEDKPPVRTIA